MRECRWGLHLDNNNAANNPDENGWVVRLWLELTNDDSSSPLVVRRDQFDKGTEVKISLPRYQQVVARLRISLPRWLPPRTGYPLCPDHEPGRAGRRSRSGSKTQLPPRRPYRARGSDGHERTPNRGPRGLRRRGLPVELISSPRKPGEALVPGPRTAPSGSGTGTATVALNCSGVGAGARSDRPHPGAPAHRGPASRGPGTGGARAHTSRRPGDARGELGLQPGQPSTPSSSELDRDHVLEADARAATAATPTQTA